MVITARFLEDSLLGTIGHQVGLANLRMVSARTAPSGDHVFDIVDGRNDPVVRFAWTPKRPGAEILSTVFPFLGIALAGFVLLAGRVDDAIPGSGHGEDLQAHDACPPPAAVLGK